VVSIDEAGPKLRIPFKSPVSLFHQEVDAVIVVEEMMVLHCRYCLQAYFLQQLF